MARLSLSTPDRFIVDAIERACAAEPEPGRLFLEGIARESFGIVASRMLAVPGLRAAYSVKTNPRLEMLALARSAGFGAEVISDAEAAHARRAGFAPDDIIYNGPVPIAQERVGLAFADSLEALERYAARVHTRVVGLRYRPSGIATRFGISSDELVRAAALVRRAELPEIALHFHVRPQDFGSRSWRDIAREALAAAADVAARSKAPVTQLDVGGGWTPARLDAAFEADLPGFVAEARRALPALRHVVLEPGQSIATPAETLAVRVVEVRVRGGCREAIVDAGYPELPQIGTYPHRVFARTGGALRTLGRGFDRICGPTCLEYDVIRADVSLADVRAGDTLWIADAGAYDASMAFPFAHGTRAAIGLAHR